MSSSRASAARPCRVRVTQVRGLPFVPLQIREMIEGEMRKLHGPHSVRTGAQES